MNAVIILIYPAVLHAIWKFNLFNKYNLKYNINTY